MKKIVLSAVAIAAITLTSCKNTNNQQNSENENVATEQMTSTEMKEEAGKFDYTVASSSVVEWVGSKPVGKHNGTVNVTGGGVSVKDQSITKGEFVIDMNTIAVLDLASGDGKEDLENHLKGTGKEDAEDHFFNVKKFPTATFVFKSFDGTNMVGDLTIKGVTKEVSFPATVTVTDAEVNIVSNSFKINRVDFGVNYASKSVFDNLKDKFINDEMELVVKVKATK
ncbi:YceI family protein [Capnocytophaga cynodegmi]|uniref:YceI family protein n=1 Tax=Capnocytophaga cynodegmi TaxID=28189 RepID=UPI00385CA2A6